MRKPIECPHCEDDLLVLICDETWTACRCRNCGWHYTWMPPPADDALDDAIQAVISASRGTLDVAGPTVS